MTTCLHSCTDVENFDPQANGQPCMEWSLILSGGIECLRTEAAQQPRNVMRVHLEGSIGPLENPRAMVSHTHFCNMQGHTDIPVSAMSTMFIGATTLETRGTSTGVENKSIQ